MIYIVTDTNILNMSYSSECDFTKWTMNKTYYELMKLRNGETIDFLLPQVVLDELVQHKREAFAKGTDIVRKAEINYRGLFSVKYVFTSEEYDELLKKEVGLFCQSKACATLIPTRCNLQTVIDDSINKRPPFEGEKGKGDKGFKDELIYLSMIEYAKKNKGTYAFLTKDGIFKGPEKKNLCERFIDETGSELKVFDDIESLTNYIESNVGHIYQDSVEVDIVKIMNIYRGYPLKNKVHIEQDMPKLVNPVQLRSIERINSDIKSLFDDACKWLSEIDFVREIEEYEMDKDEYGDEYGGNLSTTILLNKYGLVSFLFEGYDYLARGCHGDCSQRGIVYDINSGERVGFNNLISEDSKTAYSIIREACYKDSEKNHKFDPTVFDENYHSLEEVRWYLDEEGIHGFFDVYEAGCYADGFIDFLIMDGKLTKKYLKKYSERQKAKYANSK